MSSINVVQFEISGINYAIDINTAREIVEMMPITPVPRSPEHIAGIINLRGEITNVMNLNCLMGLDCGKDYVNRKIIVLVPETTGGSSVGLIVDDVQSVLQVNEEDIDQMDSSLSKEAFVKGIIKMGNAGSTKKDLVIWIDIEKILGEALAGRCM
ncbi:purine-binding chemotaxis protein CheW [Methanomicrobium sp. W14]|jgi:purine-binding chemotaxis protein CheW|uniref:chemotaxis protein CheW n=1 Tax=Methanomicrobium sp. W14 TaxID=2817839 RepID=UPI001AE5169B|nr:chemotaxis protein CheW [Methanomicrobium sp. W14]MBP2133744.1 purine-binding chemotaxis protein CheW [Methanomicrobium sp. W14]